MVHATAIPKCVPGHVFKDPEEQLKEIFRQHDANHDGLLSKAELKNAFKSLGALIPSLRAFLGLYHADANGDGVIGEEELNGLVKYASGLGYTVK